MDEDWKINKKRFLDKIDFIDFSFCTTDPSVLNIHKKHKVFYSEPLDPSLDNLNIYNNTYYENDVFCYVSRSS